MNACEYWDKPTHHPVQVWGHPLDLFCPRTRRFCSLAHPLAVVSLGGTSIGGFILQHGMLTWKAPMVQVGKGFCVFYHVFSGLPTTMRMSELDTSITAATSSMAASLHPKRKGEGVLLMCGRLDSAFAGRLLAASA